MSIQFYYWEKRQDIVCAQFNEKSNSRSSALSWTELYFNTIIVSPRKWCTELWCLAPTSCTHNLWVDFDLWLFLLTSAAFFSSLLSPYIGEWGWLLVHATVKGHGSRIASSWKGEVVHWYRGGKVRLFLDVLDLEWCVTVMHFEHFVPVGTFSVLRGSCYESEKCTVYSENYRNAWYLQFWNRGWSMKGFLENDTLIDEVSRSCLEYFGKRSV